MSFSIKELAALVLSLTLAIYGFYRRKGSGGLRLPPGPPGLPLLGNLLELPSARPHPKMLEWAHQYGAIYSLRLGPHPMVIINSAKVADELLVNRSKIYSSRAAPHVAHDILSDGLRLVTMPYTRECKISRRTMQNAIAPGPAKKSRMYQDLESRVLMKHLLGHGDRSMKIKLHKSVSGDVEVPEGHWYEIVRRFAASTILVVFYGQRVNKVHGHPVLVQLYEILDTFTRTVQAGAYLADILPFMRYLPDWLAPWRVKMLQLHEREDKLYGGFLEKIKAARQLGSAPDCLMSTYMDQRSAKGYEDLPGKGVTTDGWMQDKLLYYTGGSAIEAGAETTGAAIQSFVLFMLAEPECLRKAREEIDRVVGPDRIPTFDDQPNLPYFVACIKETLRRRPLGPLGMPHMTEQDDVYDGYFIPKGTTIVGHIWAVHMDPELYPDPFRFNPDRFYTPGKPTRMGSGNGQDTDRDHYTFGWGRRFCPGYAFAEASIFIVCSRIIWGLDFVPPVDKTGKPTIPDYMDEYATYSDGLVSIPHAFNVSWRARDPRRAAIINGAYAEAQAECMARGLDTDED